jgi:iron complex transport system ATP-binding protein
MIAANKTVLQTQDLRIGYKSKRGSKAVVAEDIHTELHAGELICLLGPNGSGKSTLIKTLAGMLPALDGRIALFGDQIAGLTSKEIARRLSTVLTDRVTTGNLTVYTMVAFGRSPYTGWLGTLSPKDEEVVRWAIESTGLREFVHRDVSRLSDGERQKVMIARALAQDTAVILLDEPTAHLDLPNRVEIISLLRKLARDTGKGILMSTHELDLALKAADRIWLMNRDRKLLTGVPEDLVLDGTFERVFEQDSFDFDRATGSFNLHRPQGPRVSVGGDTVSAFWTVRALEREGYQVREGEREGLHIDTVNESGTYCWKVLTAGDTVECASVEKLIRVLKGGS